MQDVLLAIEAVAALAAVLVALEINSRNYSAKAERRWPPLGRREALSRGHVHLHAAGPEDGVPVLLLHGASANLRELWTPVGEPLARTHRVIAIDRPGYGYSARTGDAQTLAAQADFAAEALTQVAEEPAFVIAHSLGAAVALRLAIEYPERVRGLVLIAPASHPYPGNNVWWARLAAAPVLGAAFSRWLVPLFGPGQLKGGIANTFAPAEPPEEYVEDAGVGLAFRPGAFRASAKDVIATKKEFAAQAPLYGDIMTPTIILTGDRDRVVSPDIHARALAEELAAAELITAPDAGHMPHRVRPDLVLCALHRLEAMASIDTED